MGAQEQPSREVLEMPRAYVRVDRQVLAALPELGEAIRAFVPVPGPAGDSVAGWLAEHALGEPQEAAVRVRLEHGAVTGVYALCAAQIALSAQERADLGGVRYRTQPAILLGQFARAASSPGIGGEMLEHAARIVQSSLWYVGATVMVVDPFDESTDAYWREHWGLRASEQRVPGNRSLRRLWMAIPA